MTGPRSVSITAATQKNRNATRATSLEREDQGDLWHSRFKGEGLARRCALPAGRLFLQYVGNYPTEFAVGLFKPFLRAEMVMAARSPRPWSRRCSRAPTDARSTRAPRDRRPSAAHARIGCAASTFAMAHPDDDAAMQAMPGPSATSIGLNSNFLMQYRRRDFQKNPFPKYNPWLPPLKNDRQVRYLHCEAIL